MYLTRQSRAKLIYGVFLTLMSIFGFAQSGVSAAGTAFCQPITSVPMVINRSGVYCLKRDLIYRDSVGVALEVRRNNVVIDLNGFKISGTPALGNETVGIKVSNKQKVRITNGTVERFRVGIELDRGIANSVDHVHLDQNRQFGIWQSGSGKSLSLVENTVSRTGGSSAPFAPGSLPPGFACAIVIGDGDPRAYGVQVERNTVFDVRTVNAGTLIIGMLGFADNALFKENSISGRELTVGLGLAGVSSNAIENSIVNETNTGNGLSVNAGNVYSRNTVINFSNNLFGAGLNGGGNVSIP